MTDCVTVGDVAARRAEAAPSERRVVPDNRRSLQLALSGIWLLDAVLQSQSVLFTRAFARMIGSQAAGNPALIAGPISWSSRLIGHHPVGANAGFAAIELLLALGIAWRPTVKIALAASIGWSLAVWWLGEGLGGVLTGTADPASGAPGAVIIYALLALLLWPARRGDSSSRAVAMRPAGARFARPTWLLLWGSMAGLALAGHAPQSLPGTITGMAPGEPAWLAAMDRGAGGLLAHNGEQAAVVLAVVLGLIALGIYIPPRGVRFVLAAAAAVATVIWVAGENFGGLFTGAVTDPSSGLVLVLLAAAYWPVRGTLPSPAAHDPAHSAAEAG